MNVDLIAMHGWGRDARSWEPWQRATASLGWRWQTGERGYGAWPPRVPEWPEPMRAGRRLVIGRSLGPHMIPANVLMKEIHPLGIVPYHIIMNALAYQVSCLIL